MGITGLLPLLKEHERKCHLSDFGGKTVAVDSYCLLHRYARMCSLELAKGEDIQTYIVSIMKLIASMKQNGLKVIMVFDGRPLPAKKQTEEARREAKKQAHREGVQLLRLGKAEEARKCFDKCIDITPEMAFKLIEACRKDKIDCIVAPYEADAQLAFLCKEGIADLAISEDSDLILFGCPQVLYKLDSCGNGVLIEQEKIPLCLKIRHNKYSFTKFRHICILSGCDYLKNIPGVGLKKALKFISMTAEEDPAKFLPKMPSYLRLRGIKITPEYIKDFLIADATFLHQIVFNPRTNKLVPLNPVPKESKEFCVSAGDIFDDFLAREIALGNVNPLTMKNFSDWEPHLNNTSRSSIWMFNAKKSISAVKPVDVEEVKHRQMLVEEKIMTELNFYVPKRNQKTEKCQIVQKESDVPVEEMDEGVGNTVESNPFLKKNLGKEEAATVSRFFKDLSLNVEENKPESLDVDKFFTDPPKKNEEKASETFVTNNSLDIDEIFTEASKSTEEKEECEVDRLHEELDEFIRIAGRKTVDEDKLSLDPPKKRFKTNDFDLTESRFFTNVPVEIFEESVTGKEEEKGNTLNIKICSANPQIFQVQTTNMATECVKDSFKKNQFIRIPQDIVGDTTEKPTSNKNQGNNVDRFISPPWRNKKATMQKLRSLLNDNKTKEKNPEKIAVPILTDGAKTCNDIDINQNLNKKAQKKENIPQNGAESQEVSKKTHSQRVSVKKPKQVTMEFMWKNFKKN